MSKLSDKEIEYFRELLPDGVDIVDFRDVNNVTDFVNKYGDDTEFKYTIKKNTALKNFINQVKKK